LPVDQPTVLFHAALYQDWNVKKLFCKTGNQADEAAMKQAKQQKKLVEYMKMRAEGGPDIRSFLLDFREKCPSRGIGKPRATRAYYAKLLFLLAPMSVAVCGLSSL
jgi:hypothetical protein